MKLQFTKVQGLGNDFVIVNGAEVKIDDYATAAVKICDRHFGIGADGLVIVLPAEKADFRMRIFNSDGSEAEMCGNVTRCFAKYVYEHGLTTKTRFEIETLAGIIVPELQFDAQGQVKTIRVDMGVPRLLRSKIPMQGPENEQVVNEPLQIGGEVYNITCVSMGNPHCVIFVDDVTSIALEQIGPKIETHPKFPRKINVEFVQVVNDQEMIMRVWERGAGVTLACGTGSCATLVAAVLNNKTGRKAVIHLDGGDLTLEWDEATNHIFKTGPAEEVFTGKYLGKL
jgi:diaminopimelate epimerase